MEEDSICYGCKYYDIDDEPEPCEDCWKWVNGCMIPTNHTP